MMDLGDFIKPKIEYLMAEAKERERVRNARRALNSDRNVLKDPDLKDRFPIASFDGVKLLNKDLGTKPVDETSPTFFEKTVSTHLLHRHFHQLPCITNFRCSTIVQLH